MLDGGIGRIITSIPALLKYHKNHIDEEWYIMSAWWDFLLWGIPELQERTFNTNMKGIFNIFWHANKIITPEPYRVPSYYRNEISIREAFDIEINNSFDHSDLPEMVLNLSTQERRVAFDIIDQAKETFGKEKTVVIQPYGSTAFIHNNQVYDDSLRSIPNSMVDYFIENLVKEYNVIYMGFNDFYDDRIFKPEYEPNIREWAAIIEQSDYFIGCDSCGQHMCKALNKPASVVIAGTHRKNVTYDDFHIIERDIPFSPDAMRISDFQCQMSYRLNENRIDFTDDEIEYSYEEIVNIIENL
jgi:hypothetical protein